MTLLGSMIVYPSQNSGSYDVLLTGEGSPFHQSFQIYYFLRVQFKTTN